MAKEPHSVDPASQREATSDTPASPQRRTKGIWAWCRRQGYRAFVEPLVLSRNPPHFDARGVAIGLMVGLLVPMGGHLVILGLVRVFIRFNFLVAFAFSVVNNPLNVVPLYYGYYRLGSVMLQRPAVMPLEMFHRLMHPITDKTYFWEALQEFMQLGSDLLVRWFLAALVVSIIAGIIGYFVTLRIQEKRCERAARKMGIRYEKYLEQLEAQTKAPSEASPE